MRVLIVEDSKAQRKLLEKALEQEGMDTRAVRSLSEARVFVEQAWPELIVLDLILPDGDGLAWLRRMRRASFNVPVLVISARDTVEQRVEGLAAGADDYLVKPAHVGEFVARVKALARRAGLDRSIDVGPLHVEPQDHVCTLHGEPVSLSRREFALLVALARHAGRPVMREQILSEVWGITGDPKSNIIDVYVRYLRNKLGRGWIKTVRGVGYQLQVPEEEAGQEAGEEASEG